jgi:2-oxoisovalerate dehydrogenase E1 component
VFGHPASSVIPTTSTIASHLPRAVGLGYAIERRRAARLAGGGAHCAGRDGSGYTEAAWRPPAGRMTRSWCARSATRRSTTRWPGAFNTAGWWDHRDARLPVLFVCEDNGLGISVRSPAGWVEAVLSSRPGLRYTKADGGAPRDGLRRGGRGVEWVRRERRPAVLHLPRCG